MTAKAAHGETTPVDLAAMWRFGGLSIRDLVARSIAAYGKNQLNARGAQFAFYAMLGLAPLLIVILSTVSHLPISGVRRSFLKAVQTGMPENVASLIESQVIDIQERSSLSLIAIGVVLLSIAGSRIFLTMAAALDVAYAVEHRRRIWKSGLLALGLTFVVFVMFVIALAFQVVGPILTDTLTSRVQAAWVHVALSSVVRWTVAATFLLAATSIIYWASPSVKLRWYPISPGSVFATAGWIAATQGFRLYVQNFGRYNETYGTLGAVIVLMIWLYMTGTVLMIGGQINGVIHAAATRRAEQETTAE